MSKRIIPGFIIILILSITSEDLFSQSIGLEFIWPNTMHATHLNGSDELNEDNGGLGLITTFNGFDKKYNFGFGRIDFINSFNNPGYVEILQLAEVKHENKYFRLGMSFWKMWVYGYYNSKGEGIILNIPPLPSFFSD
jgi:hypothetical protein